MLPLLKQTVGSVLAGTQTVLKNRLATVGKSMTTAAAAVLPSVTRWYYRNAFRCAL